VISTRTLEDRVHALAWLGIVLLALGILAWVVFKITIWIGIVLFVLGVILLIRGFSKAKQAL
jgi:uncharacterized membrane protein